MKKKNKVKRFAPKFSGNHVKIGKKCLDCEYASKPTVSGAKIKCTHPSKPKVTFRQKIGWICYSFSEKSFTLNEIGRHESSGET